MTFVSRGGIKLEHAFTGFKIDVKDRIVIDVGSSTGGFTDCLLQHGAKLVYAVDVGYGILDWKLRNDPRVVVVERTNARHLTPEELYERKPKADLRKPNTGSEKATLAVIDVSFISLSKIFPAVYNLLADEGEVVALIKPQFEAKRDEVERGGVVRSEDVRNSVIEKVKKEAETIGFKVKGVTRSPIEGAKGGNVEYLIWLRK